MAFKEGEFIDSRCIGYCEQCLYMIYTNDLDKPFDCSLRLNSGINKDFSEDIDLLLDLEGEFKNGG